MRVPAVVVVVVLVLGAVVSAEYNGVKLGEFSNSSYGLSGQVYLVNRTTILVRDFSLRPPCNASAMTPCTCATGCFSGQT